MGSYPDCCKHGQKSLSQYSLKKDVGELFTHEGTKTQRKDKYKGYYKKML